jgi:hypothetical protein
MLWSGGVLIQQRADGGIEDEEKRKRNGEGT